MTAPPPTILDLKLSFLSTQIRLLSTPISLPSSYASTREEGGEEEDTALRQANIDTALQKLNQRLKDHNRSVYGRLGVRHVAEQIGGLYRRCGADIGGIGGGEGQEEGEMEGQGLEKGADLANSHTITSLPSTWPSSRDPTLSTAYTTNLTRLTALSTQRAALQEKLAKYRLLRDQLEPFEDAKENVQAGLVTKGGEVEVEMERMRVLIGRVVGRLGGSKGKEVGEDEADGDGDVEMEEEEQERILGRLEELMG